MFINQKKISVVLIKLTEAYRKLYMTPFFFRYEITRLLNEAYDKTQIVESVYKQPIRKRTKKNWKRKENEKERRRLWINQLRTYALHHDGWIIFFTYNSSLCFDSIRSIIGHRIF